MLQNKDGARLALDDGNAFLKVLMPYAVFRQSNDIKDLLYALYSGNSVLVVEGFADYVIIDTRKYPARGIEEPAKDKVLRGSREGFVEALLTNSALIRRRIRDPRLIFKHLTVGQSTTKNTWKRSLKRSVP